MLKHKTSALCTHIPPAECGDTEIFRHDRVKRNLMGCYPVFSKCSATRPSHNLHPVTCLHPKSAPVKRPHSSHVHTQISSTSRIHPSATHLLSNKGFPDETQTYRAVYYNSEKTHRSRAFTFLSATDVINAKVPASCPSRIPATCRESTATIKDTKHYP